MGPVQLASAVEAHLTELLQSVSEHMESLGDLKDLGHNAL